MANRLEWETNHTTEGTRVVLPNLSQGTYDTSPASQKETIESLANRDYTLRQGEEGQEVAGLQAALLALGYSLPKYGADGDFGGETVAALKLFQQDYGISVDGVAGKQTGDTLKGLYSGQITMVYPGKGGKGGAAKRSSTIPGFSNDPLITNDETPKEEDFISEYGLLALVTVGIVYYGKKNGWFDE